MTFLILLSSALVAAAPTAAEKKGDVGPACNGVKAACEKAGYTKGARSANRPTPQSDCVNKLVTGQKVEGVSLDPADPLLGQCKAALMSSSAAKGH